MVFKCWNLQLKELSDADADKQGELKGQAIEESWQSCAGNHQGECGKGAGLWASQSHFQLTKDWLGSYAFLLVWSLGASMWAASFYSAKAMKPHEPPKKSH